MGVDVGVCVQEASPLRHIRLIAARAKMRAENKNRGRSMDAGLLLILLEAALALGLFIFIIWWTLPKKDKSDKQ